MIPYAITFAWNQLVGLFIGWISLFLAPIKDPNMLWILVPVYLNWFFSEFYQEKKGTSFGNAISNAFVAVWAGFDWSRTLFNTGPNIVTHFYIKVALAVVMLIYGAYIMVQCIKARKNIILLGRIRVVTYFILMFTPLFYGVIPLSFSIIFVMLLFFPLYYFVIEFIDWLVPDPRAFVADVEEQTKQEEKTAPQNIPPLNIQPRQSYYPRNVPYVRK